MPLTTWFDAAWHLTTAKSGLSAKTLEKTLGTSYVTAWAILQRFRVAMVRSEREQLSGVGSHGNALNSRHGEGAIKGNIFKLGTP
jgi:hypothetical protein